MKLKIWQVGLLAVLILALLAPTAWAQDTTGDRLVIGQSFVLSAGQELDGNLAVLGGSASLQSGSIVRGDVAVLGGSLTVAGTVEGDIALFGGSVSLAESAVVGGNVGVFGGSIARSEGAVVSGDVFSGDSLPFRFPLPDLPEDMPRAARPDGVLGAMGSLVLWQLVTLGWALGLALLGAIVVSIAPRAMGRIASQAAGDPFVSFGMGLLTLVIGFLLGLLLLIACCIGLLGWLALSIAWLIGWLAVGLWLGQRILQALSVRNATALGEVALGVALITVLSRLPWCIGALFGLVFGCIGLGAVVLTRFGTQPMNGMRGSDAPPAAPAADDALLLPVVLPEDAPTAAVEAPVIAETPIIAVEESSATDTGAPMPSAGPQDTPPSA